ncbi:MAG TPA: hypothetical protein VIY49_32685 [Bryobacteraceae bacterium]
MASVIVNRRTIQPAVLATAILITTVSATAQTNYSAEAAKNPGAASKTTPRMADGHPDLNGVWHHFFGIGTIEKVGDSFVVGGAFSPKSAAVYSTPLGDPKPEYKPDFVARVKSLNDNQVKEDPTLHCMPPGVPRLGPPHQIAHTPKQAIFLYADNTGNQWRVIPLDGRPHGTDPEIGATYNGDSVGHWEGDTLVVDVTRLTDETWLGDNGLFHSRKLHVTERLRRVGDTIEYKMTAEDPEVLQKPWTLSRMLTLQPDALEEAAPCVDKDAGHYVTLEHHDNTR